MSKTLHIFVELCSSIIPNIFITFEPKEICFSWTNDGCRCNFQETVNPFSNRCSAISLQLRFVSTSTWVLCFVRNSTALQCHFIHMPALWDNRHVTLQHHRVIFSVFPPVNLKTSQQTVYKSYGCCYKMLWLRSWPARRPAKWQISKWRTLSVRKESWAGCGFSV